MSRRRFLPDRIVEELEAAGSDDAFAVSRREFVRLTSAAGGGLLVAIALPGCATEDAAAASEDAASGEPFEPSAWVRIDPDGSATVTVAKSEMGQGVRTTLALIVAEELDLDWDRVEVAQAPADPDRFGNQGTGGSASVRTSWTPLREAGARARAALVAAAAAELDVPGAELETRASRVVHRASGREISYGELTAAAAERPLPEEVSLKAPAEWRLLGRERVIGVDVDDIVTGRPVYGSDVREEGMLYAAVARTPSHGGTVARYDASRALETPGVHQVVEVEPVGSGVHVHAGVAVVAENSWAAIRGRDALEIEWDRGPFGDDTSEEYSRRMRAATEEPGAVTVNRVGDPDGALEGADGVISHVYEVPFIAHATMEPMTTVAEVTGGRCRLRSPSQFPNWAAGATAQALGIPRENVELTVPLLGGGYGRRINPDYAVEAALVAREVDGPVKVVWTREDDMRHDFYRPCAVHRIEAVLGEDGHPAAWRHRFCDPAIGATYEEEANEEGWGVDEGTGSSDMPYRVPHRSSEYTHLDVGLTRGWWRAVSTTHGTFAVECFIDELAERAGVDPVDYRLALIDVPEVDRPSQPEEFPFEPERLKGVLRTAAEAAGWGEEPPEGHARGVACGIDHLSYAAEVVELAPTDEGVRIEKVTCAVDCGPVINPDGARAQVQGALIQGLSAALKERLTVRDGAIREGNFDSYRILRIHEAPREIDVHFVQTDTHPTGLGEPGLPPAAPALANALYALTGRRRYTLPLEV